MGSEWRQTTLDQLGTIITGKTPPSGNPTFFGGDIPFVTPTDMDGRRLISRTSRYLTSSGAAVIANSRVPRGAVMVSCIGSDMGKAAVAGSDCVTNQQLNSLVVTTDDDPLFIYYNLSLRKAEIRQGASGSAQPILNKSAFGRLPIRLPSPSQQRWIAQILGALDDKIELNHRMSQTLESMARALFKSWFVDFDPVRAKAEGRNTGLPVDLNTMFPSALEESALGETPVGWWADAVVGFADVNPESWSSATRPSSIEYVDLTNTKTGRIEATTTYATADAPSRAQRVLRPGDTIFGTVRPGNRSYALVAGKGLTGSTGFAVLRPKKADYRDFVYLSSTSIDAIDELARLADGAAYPAIAPERVAATRCVRPPESLLSRFHRAAGPMLDRLAGADREAAVLRALRDGLLARLLSGSKPT